MSYTFIQLNTGVYCDLLHYRRLFSWIIVYYTYVIKLNRGLYVCAIFIGVGAQSTDICPKNLQNSRILHDFCPKMSEFYIIIARKIFSSNFRWARAPCPRLLRLCEGGGIEDRGWYRSKERWWVPTGPPIHSNFSSIFTRFRDIAAFVLQNAIFPFPTSSLPKISPCSPGSRWIAFWLQRAKVLG